MAYFIITLIVLALFIAGMAIGVIFGKDPLKGSCGGLNKVMGQDEECQFCGKKEECEKRLKALAEQAVG